ncbi:Uncharacterized protein FKW44_000237 [Caligus rogercresseyi]|uniref:Uncharacterized protein n=1 Tax=Caligus rogercresseyi TaxID=217165 RepID=A0A7T8QUQ5_CALRO|nr:Uncharacterized protein FKW44_000237 [Caligus rogercresseyi]
MEKKRIRVSALLDSQMDFRKIAEVKKLKDEGQDLGKKPGSGGHNKKRTAEFLADLSDTIEASPTTSTRKQAKNLGVSKDTIRNAVQDLGLVSYVRIRRQLLSDASKETRVIKGKKLLTWMNHNGSTVRIFSDKKLWTVDQVRNSKNDRYLAYCIEEVPPSTPPSTQHRL